MKNKNKKMEKPKNFKKAIGYLSKNIKSYLPAIIFALVLAIIGSYLTIIGPDHIKEMVNEITKGIVTGIDLDKVKAIGLYLIIIYIISALASYFQGYILATVSNKYTFELRKQILRKINYLPLKYYDKTQSGDLLSRITNDADTIGHTMAHGIGQLVSAITLLIGVLYMMFITNPLLSITTIFSSIIGFILLVIIFSKSQKYFTELQKELGNINGHVEEVYSGHNVVKAYNGYKNITEKFNQINDKLYNSSRKSQFISGLMGPIMGFVGNFGYVSVSIVGALVVVNNNISIGTVVAFMIYVRLFSQPLATLAQTIPQIQLLAAASERVFEFLAEDELKKETNITKILEPNKVKGFIEFKNVKFGYKKNKPVIKNFSAKIKPGQKVAIVGPTGAGKTTIVNLIMRFYELDSGDITIDGISTKELTRENIQDLFIMVLQDTWLFNGTIIENINFNKENISFSEIEDACQKVGVDHFIRTLPDGYDTVMTDGESISAGQKQLLTIVRGMIKNSPFLILDEATSSVDTRTEELVQKAMDKLTHGRTSFIIAHRLSTIKNADLILVLKDGNIIEQGNHKKLIKKNSYYAELYNSQFEN